MTTLRACYRLLILVVSTITGWCLLLAILPWRRWSPGRHLRWRDAIFRRWGRRMLRGLGARVSVEGTPPDGAFFLVSNHLGYTDIFMLAACAPPAFVAKAELRSWPLIGWVLVAADTIFINRGRRGDVVRVMEIIRTGMARGLGIVFFPEGTSGKGDQLLHFKPSLLELPARDEQPVHYACLHYETTAPAPPAHQAVCWWGDAPFVPHLWQLLRIDGFEARLRFGAAPVTASTRKELAAALHTGIATLFEPIA